MYQEVAPPHLLSRAENSSSHRNCFPGIKDAGFAKVNTLKCSLIAPGAQIQLLPEKKNT